jgi:cis-3-alkyl-4-acyloxetan-2-one decarboxylase
VTSERQADFPTQLYPFKSNFLDLGSLKYHYLDEGSRDAHPVVMLHGNPTWSFYYRNVVLGLRDQFRCIVPDHIGCGLSDKPQDYPYTLKQHIENAEGLLNRLEVKSASLIVHDWGGAIGMGVAARKPERIRKLVILNTAAFQSPRIPLRINICKIPGFGAIAIRGLNGFAGAAIYMAVNHRERMTREVVRGLLYPYRSWHDRIANLRFVQDIPMSPKHPTWQTLKDVETGLAHFKSNPMLICWGMKDWCFDESFLKTWIEKFPSATVERYDDAGHYVLEDAHERIVPRVRDFLLR